MKKIYLYVDDLRQSPVPSNEEIEVIVARTYKEAIRILNTKEVVAIDLDHDLGGNKTGYDIAKYIVENGIKIDIAVVHTANPVGRENIMNALKYHCEVIEYNV